MSAPRYAVYFAPPTESKLWSLGSAWLGRDAATGAVLEQPSFGDLPAAMLHDLTGAPRRYGLHATLKPPMALGDGISESELLDSAERWARQLHPGTLNLEVASLSGFVAIVPSDGASADAAQALAEDAVRFFEPLRRPATAPEVARRRSKANLSEREDELMVRWGYPYVMEMYRFHITLTERTDSPTTRTAVMARATAWFEAVLTDPVPFASVSIFREPEGGGEFEVLQTFAMGG